MGKRKAAKTTNAPQVALVTEQQSEKLLATWTTRELQIRLQCSPDEAQQAAGLILSMSPQQLRDWCNDLLVETEKRLDEDRRFYNAFMDKKEELGLLRAEGTQAGSQSAVIEPSETASESGTLASTATTATVKSKRKYNKQIDLTASRTGLDAILPVSQECNCEATKHKLLTNCMYCGKIVCQQEGWGRCYFCGSEVSKDSKPVRTKTDTDDAAFLEREREFLRSVADRDRLIKFQDERTKRTTIVDDQEDYYESTTNPWLNATERKAARDKEDKAKEERLKRTRRSREVSMAINLATGKFEQHDELPNKTKPPPELVAPFEKRQQEEEAVLREKLASGDPLNNDPDAGGGADGNIFITNDAVYNPIPVSLEELDEDELQEISATEEHRVKGLRVVRCPDAKDRIQFDPTAMLRSWTADYLMELEFEEEDADKMASFVTRMTNLPSVKSWALRELGDESYATPFVDAFFKESNRLQLQASRQKKKQTVEDEEGKPSVGKTASRGHHPSRVQTDFEETNDEVETSVKKMVGGIRSKKPWVYINSAIAEKLDQKSNVKAGNKCMSMHQPWASLLVCGVKKHEGRSWGTDFRGRLWIHAAAHAPSQEDIDDTEAFYAARGATTFPTHYPTSVLLGCVTVTDVLHCDAYAKLPAAEQESSSEYVFICSNPQLLVLPLPMDGNHKIFPIDKNTHEAARRQAGGRPSV
ncbi:hypothetical protein DIPPA_27772 [Diplonema papillatum]|nr:hypothetical protein DIPPA_27772 [Diplonema papillatum]